MAQPEAHNFRLISHDTMRGFGNVGEGMSLQLAPGGRRIMWMAHECAPKNFTGVDVTDPTQAAGDRTDRSAASQRAFQLAGGLRQYHGGRLPDRHARCDTGGDRAVRHLQAGRAAQHQLLRLVRPTVARRASAVVHRRQDDALLRRCGGFHAAQPEGRPVAIPRSTSSDPAKPRELGRWWYPGTEESDEAPPVPRHPKFDTGWRAHNTNVYPERPDRAYVGYIDGGACVLDISDIGKPKMVGHWNPHPPFPGFTHTVMPLFDRDLLM